MSNMTTKDIAIREVIEKRTDILREIIKNCKNAKSKSWYEGRLRGLMDVYELLGDSEESIRIEL